MRGRAFCINHEKESLSSSGLDFLKNRRKQRAQRLNNLVEFKWTLHKAIFQIITDVEEEGVDGKKSDVFLSEEIVKWRVIEDI